MHMGCSICTIQVYISIAFMNAYGLKSTILSVLPYVMTMTDGRIRYRGTGDDLGMILLEFANSRSFISYPDESDKVEDARLHVDGIAKHHGILSALHDVQANLSFPRAVVHDAMQYIIENTDKFTLNAEHVSDWKITMTRRLRNMCHSVAAGCARKHQASWVAALPWMHDHLDHASKKR